MITIKKIVSMCPAAPGWRSRYKDDSWAAVAVWALIELTDGTQLIVPLTEGRYSIATIASLDWEIKNSESFDFSP